MDSEALTRTIWRLRERREIVRQQIAALTAYLGVATQIITPDTLHFLGEHPLIFPERIAHSETASTDLDLIRAAVLMGSFEEN